MTWLISLLMLQDLYCPAASSFLSSLCEGPLLVVLYNACLLE